ncbi:MAG: PepSY domain-containing protein [Caulobacterales bacterium]|uniref:PepSY domain-containing protein n=1 Tax=Glycocaulis sp. TaxID=1969725 RepID=UPI003FA1459F
MMKRYALLLTALAALAAADAHATGVSGEAQAFDPRSRYSADEARNQSQAGNVVPARVAIDNVRQRYPGAEVLDVELVRSGSPYYIVKILTREGRRIDVRVDGVTGRVQ